jgi:hypothetical protein
MTEEGVIRSFVAPCFVLRIYLFCVLYQHNNNDDNNKWHYIPDGHKPPLIGSIAENSAFAEQVANLLPQRYFESA